MKLQYKKTWLVIVSVFLFFVSYSVNAAGTPPEFRANGQTYSSYTQVDATHWTVEDGRLKATIIDLGNNQWQLDLQAKQTISDVWFPYMSAAQPLDGNIADDLYYWPTQMGQTDRVDSVPSWDGYWLEYRYPGKDSSTVSSPFVIMADDDNGIIAAATNWPAREAKPRFGGQRVAVEYPDDTIAVGTTRTFGGILAHVTGNTTTGQVPWQLAADYYKNWLNSKMFLPNYPDWMKKSEGMFNVQLENTGSDITFVKNLWQSMKNDFPWVLMWGQMRGGGCCVPAGMNPDMIPDMDPKFIPQVPDWTKSIIAQGGHVGYYSSPYHTLWQLSNPSSMGLTTAKGLGWLVNWQKKNLTYSADSHYIDTMTSIDWFTDPGIIRDYFLNGQILGPSLIEQDVDVYPGPYLSAGSLRAFVCGAPFKDDNPLAYKRTSFPRLSRYILGDRIFYRGGSNVDWIFWSTIKSWPTEDYDNCNYAAYCSANGPCEYGVERLGFLMGEKFEFRAGEPGSEIMNMVIAERKRVNWWDRWPTYLDTKDLNLTGIPLSSKVQIRHHKDKSGVDLLTISNPLQRTGLSFSIAGQTFQVPTQKIAIIDTGSAITPSPAPIPTPSPSPTLKGDLNKDGIVNSLDWSIMNSKWFTSDSTADLNSDGIVNSLDFSIMNGNWLKIQ
ncbi:hypothetical protein HY389_00815 [Candidatus Daviesbacteria bacterium]|nr:hypothetical protein [Candidatus Daviesbacteria bacterium]